MFYIYYPLTSILEQREASVCNALKMALINSMLRNVRKVNQIKLYCHFKIYPSTYLREIKFIDVDPSYVVNK